MIRLGKPTNELQRRFLDEQAARPYSYDAVGATASQPPAGYVVDHNRACLGAGEQQFAAAKAALRQWRQFQLGWVEPWPLDVRLVPGECVAIIAHLGPVYWLNACRLVYAVDERGPVERFGFAYGTLPDHAERGEERFVVEWNRADDQVWFDILAFSRPNHSLSWLGYPVVRRLQKRFAREALAAMQRAVEMFD
ncbi:MAG: DUF1990 family protein [Pirellulales bacterium]